MRDTKKREGGEGRQGKEKNKTHRDGREGEKDEKGLKRQRDWERKIMFIETEKGKGWK